MLRSNCTQRTRSRVKGFKGTVVNRTLPYFAWSCGHENFLVSLSEAEFKEFEPRLKFKPRLKFFNFSLRSSLNRVKVPQKVFLFLVLIQMIVSVDLNWKDEEPDQIKVVTEEKIF